MLNSKVLQGEVCLLIRLTSSTVCLGSLQLLVIRLFFDYTTVAITAVTDLVGEPLTLSSNIFLEKTWEC